MEFIEITKNNTLATVSNDGIVTSLKVGDIDVLSNFLPTLHSGIGSMHTQRGGIPSLIPQSGDHGSSFSLPDGKHGFGFACRNWRILTMDEDTCVIKLSVEDYHDEIAKYLHSQGIANSELAAYQAYPFEVDFVIRIKALNKGIRLDLLSSNIGETLAPIAPGFHPYLNTASCRLSDHNIDTKYELLDLNGESLDLPIQKYWIELETENRKLNFWMLPSKGFLENKGALVIAWTDSEDYLCIEPWTRDSEGLSRNPIMLQPGQSYLASMTIIAHEGSLSEGVKRRIKTKSAY